MRQAKSYLSRLFVCLFVWLFVCLFLGVDHAAANTDAQGKWVASDKKRVETAIVTISNKQMGCFTNQRFKVSRKFAHVLSSL